MSLTAQYLLYCPNCGGSIEEERLIAGQACRDCQPNSELIREGRLTQFHRWQEDLSDWCSFFKEKSGSEPWPLQRLWASRILRGQSFAMLAPTGIGKTTFGLVMAGWLAQKNRRAYLVFPTRLLVEQCARRLQSMNIECVAYLGRKEEKQAIVEGDERIALFTTAFLYRHANELPGPVDFLFIDDVDSVLKTGRTLDRLLPLVGFSSEDIARAYSLLSLRQREPQRAEEQAQQLRAKARGVVVVASATARPRTRRILLFRELCGFEVGQPEFALRRVVDLYEDCSGLEREELWRRSVWWLQKLGSGGLIFLSGDLPKETALEYRNFLQNAGLKALTYMDEGALERFARSEVDYLVGFASWRNPLARGIDLPERVRFALFVGVPKLRFKLSLRQEEPEIVVRVGLSLLPVLREYPVAKVIQRMRRGKLSPEQVSTLFNELKNLLQQEEFRQRVFQHPEIILHPIDEDTFEVVMPDITGYLQASGRTSRLTAAGLLRGLSLVLADSQKALTAWRRRLAYLVDREPSEVNEVSLSTLLQEIDEDRQQIHQGSQKGFTLPTRLVVVESPSKARTLAGLVGRPVRRYLPGLVTYEVLSEHGLLTITATRGHVTDLTLRGGLYGVDVKEQEKTFIPRYHPLMRCGEEAVPATLCPDGKPAQSDKDLALRTLQEQVLDMEAVYIATDPDTEGEKIAWDVYLALRPFTDRIYRAEFHAVTRREFLHALNHARPLNEQLVKAQKVRRIADRWLGFALSELLQTRFGQRTLSAGRVQTPVLGWVLEREREFRSKAVRTTVKWQGLTISFPGEHTASQLIVEIADQEKRTIEPPPPFTTDLLLAEATRRLRFSVNETMRLAQDLFEAGLITYHRTDSRHITPEGQALARRLIEYLFSPEEVQPRSWAPPGTHEAIRPTRAYLPSDLEEQLLMGNLTGLTRRHLRLYELIFWRFVASQMKAASAEVTHVRFRLGEAQVQEEVITAIYEKGWTQTPLSEVKVLPIHAGTYEVEAVVQRLPSAPRYTEGTLVAEMKKRGLGRPSTYALIVERLLQRGYITRVGNYLVPRKKGFATYSFLQEFLDDARLFISEDWTRELESWMDRIEQGAAPEPILEALLTATRQIQERTQAIKSHKPIS